MTIEDDDAALSAEAGLDQALDVLAANLRRGRELGLLRLVGAAHRHVRSMARWEAGRWEAGPIIAIGPGLGLAITAVPHNGVSATRRADGP